MNDIMKAKRKAHMLVNYAFYFLFFAAGFLVGGGNLQKLIETLKNLF